MKSHSLDMLSLCFGIAFLAIAVLWLLAHFDSLTPGTTAGTIGGSVLAMTGIGLGHARLRMRSGPDHG